MNKMSEPLKSYDLKFRGLRQYFPQFLVWKELLYTVAEKLGLPQVTVDPIGDTLYSGKNKILHGIGAVGFPKPSFDVQFKNESVNWTSLDDAFKEAIAKMEESRLPSLTKLAKSLLF